MKFRHAVSGGDEKIELQMVPMIDIVFQLLIFFVLTFNPSVPEGDFSIEMPQRSSDADDLPPVPFIHVRLIADSNRDLSRIVVNKSKTFEADDDPYGKLQNHIINETNKGSAAAQKDYREKAEVKIEADFNLKYQYTIRAITAVTAYTNDNDDIIDLLHNIKFVQQKPPPPETTKKPEE